MPLMASRTLPIAPSLAARRAFSQTSRSNAYKDDQDKDSLKRTSHEYSLTEPDEAAAHRPEHERIEQGLSRDPSKGGKPAKGGRGRLYAGEAELISTDKGPSSAQTEREEKENRK